MSAVPALGTPINHTGARFFFEGAKTDAENTLKVLTNNLFNPFLWHFEAFC